MKRLRRINPKGCNELSVYWLQGSLTPRSGSEHDSEIHDSSFTTLKSMTVACCTRNSHKTCLAIQRRCSHQRFHVASMETPTRTFFHRKSYLKLHHCPLWPATQTVGNPPDHHRYQINMEIQIYCFLHWEKESLISHPDPLPPSVNQPSMDMIELHRTGIVNFASTLEVFNNDLNSQELSPAWIIT